MSPGRPVPPAALTADGVAASTGPGAPTDAADVSLDPTLGAAPVGAGAKAGAPASPPSDGHQTAGPGDGVSAAQALSAPPTGPLAAPTVSSTADAAGAARAAAAQPELGAALTRLRHKGNGTSELSVSLHPAELGSVGVTATVRDGLLTVTVACADRAAHDAVTAALPTLRNDLAAAGFTGIDVAVGDGGRHADPHRAPAGSPFTPADGDQPATDAPLRRPATHLRTSTDRGIDRWL